MAASYKVLKEEFVSNLTGGEISEINYVTGVATTAILLWSALQSRLSFFTPYGPAAFLTDFLLNCGALLSAVTVYSSAPILLNIFLITPAVLTCLASSSGTKHKKARLASRPGKNGATSSPPSLPNPLPHRPFLTHYRGGMMMITCLAILAVDFRVFPRRFAKVESWGTSIMDLGVGSFVFSGGMMSARTVLREQLEGRSIPLGRRLYGSIKHSVPLLVMGLIRLYSVKNLDYAEHVSEYGVHWNFFFTLGFLPPFVALFQSFFAIIPSYALLSILLGLAYESALAFTNLKAFILVAARTDLFSKNREGIFSFFGYLAIFLAGQATGMYVLPRSPNPNPLSNKPVSPAGRTPRQQRKALLITLVTWSVIWTVLYNISSNPIYGLNLSVSRRLANLPYFLWTAAYNCWQLTAYCLVETALFPSLWEASSPDAKEEAARSNGATSRILHAFNRNGLPVFLLANLLTGLINLNLPTLDMDDLQAMLVLVVYAIGLSGLAVGLDILDITIKM